MHRKPFMNTICIDMYSIQKKETITSVESRHIDLYSVRYTALLARIYRRGRLAG